MLRPRWPVLLVGLAVVVASASVARAEAEGQAPPPALTGSVVDSQGQPVAGAKVYALFDPAAPPVDQKIVEARVGQDGRFRIDVKGQGPFTVHAEAAGFASADRPEVKPDEPATIPLSPGRVFEGRVFDMVSNKPLAGAEAIARLADGSSFDDPAQPDRFAPRARTDETGRFKLTSLASKDYTLSVRADGRRSQKAPVHIGGEAPGVPRAFYLLPGGALAGKVVDKKGKPVANVEVEALSANPLGQRDLSHSDTSSRTTKTGEFEIGGLPPGPYTIVAYPKGYAEFWVAVGVVEGRRAPPLLLVLEKGSTLKAVLRAGEAPYAGKVTLRAEYEGQGAGPARRVWRSAEECKLSNGVLAVENLPPGRADVTVGAAGYKDAEVEKVLIKPGEPVDLGPVTLQRGAAIAGRVEDREGKGVKGIPLKALSLSQTGASSSGEAESAEDGSFTISNLAPGLSYTVSGGKKGQGFVRQADVKVDAGLLTLVLRQPGNLRGRVLAGDPGRPVVMYSVELTPTAGAAGGDMSAVLRLMGFGARTEFIRDAQGEFRIGDLEPDTYSLRISATGYVPGRLENLEVKTADTLDVGDVRLEKGSIVRVSVVDKKTKSPVGGARVGVADTGLAGVMRSADADRPPDAAAGPEGQVVLDGLAPGRITVKAEREGYAPRTIDVDVQADAPLAEATIELSAGGTIEGAVRDKTGAPGSGVMVGASSGMDASRQLLTTTDDAGYYRLEHLSPATYMVFSMPLPAEKRGAGASPTDLSQLQMQSVSVEEDKVVRADFPKGASAGSVIVRGRVRRGKTPLEARVIWAKASSAGAATDFATATSGVDGAFEVRLGSAGRYQVRVQPAGADTFDAGFGLPVEIPAQTEVEQDIVQPEGAIAGRLIDADTGLALKGTRVVAVRVNDKGEPEATDPIGGAANARDDGSFRIDGLRRGSYRLSVSVAGYGAEFTSPLDVGEDKETQQSVQLSRVAAVDVRVVGDGAQPVPGAIVITMENFYAALGRLDTLTDADGRFTLRELGPGSHELIVIAPGYAPALKAGVSSPGEKEKTGPIEIQLERGGGLKLRVLDASEQPLAGAAVRIKGEGGRDLTQLVAMSQVLSGRGFTFATSGAGTIGIDALAAGTYEIQIVRGDDVAARKTVKVKSGETQSLDIKLK